MATQYLKIAGKTGMFVAFDDVTNRIEILLRTDLQREKNELETRIGTPDPNQPKTNADWIAWAKANYPYTDHSAEQARLDAVNAVILAIKDL
jgi:hypothetical protein